MKMDFTLAYRSIFHSLYLLKPHGEFLDVKKYLYRRHPRLDMLVTDVIATFRNPRRVTACTFMP